MTTFNKQMTIEEATIFFKYEGATMFPKTEHNMKMMRTLIDNKLKQLRNE